MHVPSWLSLLGLQLDNITPLLIAASLQEPAAPNVGSLPATLELAGESIASGSASAAAPKRARLDDSTIDDRARELQGQMQPPQGENAEASLLGSATSLNQALASAAAKHGSSIEAVHEANVRFAIVVCLDD